MKKTGKQAKKIGFLAIVLIAVIGLSMIACGGEGEGSVKILISIAVTKMPTKVAYAIDEAFDPAGMEVTALFSTGTEVVTGYTNSNLDSATEGSKPVTITYTYGGVPAIFTIYVVVLPATITNPDVVESIKITTPPLKTQYNIGEDINLTGLTVTATLTNSSTTPVLGYSISEYDKTTAGIKIITVTYFEKTDTFTVSYIDPSRETVATPTAVPAAGSVVGTQSIALSTTTPGATIYYTTDGSVPKISSTVYTAAISVSTTTTIKAFAVKDGMNDSDVLTALYEFQAAKPTANPEAGNYTTAQTVVLATTTEYAVIYYTLDGTDPTVDEGTHYDGPISVTEATTIKAIAVKTGITDSEILTVAYTFSVATPTASVASGNYTTAQSVTLATTTDGAAIHYTLDGTAPTAESTLYSGAISIDTSKTIKAIAVKNGWSDSDVLTAAYTLTAAQPTADTPAGNYIATKTISLTTTTAGATIRYTTDGTNPTATTGTAYTAPIPISSTTTIKAAAFKTGWTTSTVLSVTYNYTYIPLTADTWADGTIASSTGNNEQWFKFKATATTQYIHFLPGTSTGVNVQLYQADGTTASGSSSTFSTTNLTLNRAQLTIDNDYFIKVTYTYYSGTYKIGFNETTLQPPVTVPQDTDITLLTANTFADGSITAGGVQWFKFTASATSHYIHFYTGALYNVYIQVYNDTGRGTGARTNLTGTTLYSNQTGLVPNSDYYIKVTPYSSSYNGAYKIGFNTTTAQPPITVPTTSVTSLSTAYGIANITTIGGEQWFKFTASAGTNYIYFEPDTLVNVYVQMYTSSGAIVAGTSNANTTNLTTSVLYTSRASLTASTEYYIRSYASTVGKCSIGVTSSTTPPAITTPATTITLNTTALSNGAFDTTTREQWFKFKPDSSTTLIYFQPGDTNPLTNVYVRLYNTSGILVDGAMTYLSSTGNNPVVTTRTVNPSTDYYVRVTPTSTTSNGSFKIGLTLPTATQLTPGYWSDGNITTVGGEQWFKFTAKGTSHYIYFQPGTGTGTLLTDVYVQMYTNTGANQGITSNLYGSSLNTSRTGLTNDIEYYIRVWPYNTTGSNRSGTFKIGVSASSAQTAPTTAP